MNTLHAHIFTASADCDGPMYDTWVETFNDEEVAERELFLAAERGGARHHVSDFSDINFMNRVFISRCGPYAVRQMRVTVEDGGFEWHEDTEEGYRRGEVTWCQQDCDLSERSHRDVYAEQMNY